MLRRCLAGIESSIFGERAATVPPAPALAPDSQDSARARASDPMTTKRDLLNYLEFMKANGFLYVEPAGCQLMTRRPGETSAPANGQRAAKASPAAPAAADMFGFAADTSPAGQQPRSADMNTPPLTRAERIERLQDAARRAETCRECPLGHTRDKLVFADGDPEARIVFVGEAPGGEEDRQGLPFVGRAGQLLNKMIVSIGFTREEVFICNTLKCRPPDNRDPKPEEKQACEHFLVEQLEILKPGILVALGAHAAQYLCRSELTIGKLRGRWHSYCDIPLLATYHPAFLLRSPQFKERAWEDMRMIHAKYGELYPDDPRKLWRRE